MTHETVVLNLGMPRSGTTLIQKMLEQGLGYFHQKVSEHHQLHTLQGAGLISLVNLFRHKTVVVVHTWRDPTAVTDSMRVGVEMGNQHPWSGDEVRGLCVQERRNFGLFGRDLQDDKVLDPTVRVKCVDIHYHDLGHPSRRAEHLWKIAAGVPMPDENFIRWSDYLDSHWMKKPVNVGRLARSLGPSGGP